MPNVIVVKVGASKRIPQSRIWLEGSRLISAGFSHGTRYNVAWNAHGAVLIPDAAGARKVAGAVDRPIIDITGEKVRALCATLCTDRVVVIYSAQKIEIERGE
jgi:hypothetical protein